MTGKHEIEKKTGHGKKMFGVIFALAIIGFAIGFFSAPSINEFVADQVSEYNDYSVGTAYTKAIGIFGSDHNIKVVGQDYDSLGVVKSYAVYVDDELGMTGQF